MNDLGLNDLLGKLRSEIETAQAAFANKTPLFSIKVVEAEVHFVIDRTTSGGGGLHLHFIAVDGKHEYRSEEVHKLKIVLEPTTQIAFAER